MARESSVGVPINLKWGLWTTDVNSAPIGSLSWAAETEYRGVSGTLCRRHGIKQVADTELPSDSVTPDYLVGMALYDPVQTSFTDQEGGTELPEALTFSRDGVVKAWYINGPNIFQKGSAFLDSMPVTNRKQFTSLFYKERLYISNGDIQPRVYYGGAPGAANDTDLAGIPAPTIQPGVSAKGKTTTAGQQAFQLAPGQSIYVSYRWRNSVTERYSNLANDGNGELLYGTIKNDDGTLNLYFDSIEVSWPDTLTPPSDTRVDSMQIFATRPTSASSPDVFYLVGLVSGLTPGSPPPEAVKTVFLETTVDPTTGPGTTGDGAGWDVNDPSLLGDNDLGTTGLAGFIFGDVSESQTPAQLDGVIHTPALVEERDDWQITIDWYYLWITLTGFSHKAIEVRYCIDYPTASWQVADDFTYNLDAQSASLQTVITPTFASPTSSDKIAVQFRLLPSDNAGDTNAQTFVGVQEVSLRGGIGATEGFTWSLGAPPIGNESDFINANNVDDWGLPPKRIFPTTYEEHALGVDDDIGNLLVYSKTGEAEGWPIHNDLTAFPYRIPFEEKEGGRIVGAEKTSVGLVVFSTDSVWIINHLPVVNDPEGRTPAVFAEARATSKFRISNTVGCVSENAYCTVQLTHDRDMVFFWSKNGPMLTDGNRVWPAADHVDWRRWLNTQQQTASVVNDTKNKRILVTIRSKHTALLFNQSGGPVNASNQDTTNDMVFVFHYNWPHLLTMWGSPRLKVTGPWKQRFSDMVEIRDVNDEKYVLAASGTLSSGDASFEDNISGLVFRLDDSTDTDTWSAEVATPGTSDGSIPYRFITNPIAIPGKQVFYDQYVYLMNGWPSEIMKDKPMGVGTYQDEDGIAVYQTDPYDVSSRAGSVILGIDWGQTVSYTQVDTGLYKPSISNGQSILVSFRSDDVPLGGVPADTYGNIQGTYPFREFHSVVLLVDGAVAMPDQPQAADQQFNQVLYSGALLDPRIWSG